MTDDMEAFLKMARDFADPNWSDLLRWQTACNIITRLADALEAQRPGREEIAREIEPRAFGEALNSQHFTKVRESALAKADAVLRLFGPAPLPTFRQIADVAGQYPNPTPGRPEQPDPTDRPDVATSHGSAEAGGSAPTLPDDDGVMSLSMGGMADPEDQEIAAMGRAVEAGRE